MVLPHLDCRSRPVTSTGSQAKLVDGTSDAHLDQSGPNRECGSTAAALDLVTNKAPRPRRKLAEGDCSVGRNSCHFQVSGLRSCALG
ncbi:hypothetical protein BDW67DRAFT_164070 [Aspergillus spinulosporus]